MPEGSDGGDIACLLLRLCCTYSRKCVTFASLALSQRSLLTRELDLVNHFVDFCCLTVVCLDNLSSLSHELIDHGVYHGDIALACRFGCFLCRIADARHLLTNMGELERRQGRFLFPFCLSD